QINLNDTLVTIYDVHLANPLIADDFDPKAHGEGITALLDLLANESQPLIVAGDFNMTDASTDYGRMTENLVDSFRESGSGFGLTFPAWSPLLAVRLDYIFHSSDLRSLKTEVVSSSGESDHFPVRSELMIDHVPVTQSP
ncbi:MAG: endonuclease/exonuclease/phosphatase family protein, partial [Chloroflexota bacterium]